MSASNVPTQKITLARDLEVGPRGGLRKAGETLELPVTDARLLLMQGMAREPGANLSNSVPATPTKTGTAKE